MGIASHEEHEDTGGGEMISGLEREAFILGLVFPVFTNILKWKGKTRYAEN